MRVDNITSYPNNSGKKRAFGMAYTKDFEKLVSKNTDKIAKNAGLFEMVQKIKNHKLKVGFYNRPVGSRDNFQLYISEARKLIAKKRKYKKTPYKFEDKVVAIVEDLNEYDKIYEKLKNTRALKKEIRGLKKQISKTHRSMMKALGEDKADSFKSKKEAIDELEASLSDSRYELRRIQNSLKDFFSPVEKYKPN